MLSSTLHLRRLPTRFAKQINMISSERRMSEQAISSIVKKMRSIEEFGVGKNSVDRYLQIDNDKEAEDEDSDKARSHPSMRIPRQVLKAHYSRVFTEKSPSPYVIHLSKSCAEMLQLQIPDETGSSEELRKKFASVFVGNDLMAGLDRPYCMNYGCHCYGQWFGQLGDGRAITLGEVYTEGGDEDSSEYYGHHLHELQLKGAGKSPYSRGFDGKAVLRSSVREYLASECMYHLGVPTTRALSLIGTGSLVRRPWYRSNSERNPYEKSEVSRTSRNSKFSPDALLMEPGAVVCRVSKSFLRFGNLELFAMRKEIQELVKLADFACFKEFPYLLRDDAHKGKVLDDCPDLIPGNADRYVMLYRAIAQKTALLVSEWMRVGYVQGNMNSDNTMLAGRTIDYGPFGFMEKFDPFFQPFTSDTDGKFSYLRQPNAMSINVAVLGSTAFTALVKAVSQSPDELGRCLSDVEHIRDKEFANFFWTAYDDVRRRKLGFKHFSEETDGEFWLELQNLMHKSESDFTIFFRELSTAAGSADSLAALLVLQRSFSQPEDSSRDAAPTAAMTSFNEMDEKLKASWLQWLDKYLARIQSDNRPVDDRRQEQNLANPKYIIRNWMSVLAYESAAEKADYSVIDELMTLLQRPYEEGTLQQEQRWYRSTPPWARNMPGVAFMS